MAFRDLLTQKGTLQKGAVVRSSTGEETITWSSVQLSVSVLTRRIGRNLADVILGVQERVTHVILSELNPELQENPNGHYQWVVDGKTYTVVDVVNPANRNHHLEIHVRRV